MTYRFSALALLLMIGACDFDLGSDEGTRERSTAELTPMTNDAGVTTFVNEQGCTFVPCSDPYGTNCGFVCPTQ